MTEHGHCLAEVQSMLRALMREQGDRMARGDAKGAMYTGRHIQRVWSKLSPAEQRQHALDSDRRAGAY